MPTQEFLIESAGGPISLMVPEGVMAPSPYSEFMARHMPRMDGYKTLDLGAGSGVQGIAGLKLGAEHVIFADKNPKALSTAMENARLNGYGDQVEALEPGNMFEPLGNRKVDVVVCNPAQLPMPRPDQPENSPYYAGEDGRDMIKNLIADSPRYMNRGGGLLFILNSMSSLYETKWKLLWANGFVSGVLATMDLPFRDFYDKDWIHRKALRTQPIDLRYEERDVGPYFYKNGVPHERLYLMGAALNPYDISSTRDGNDIYLSATVLPNFLNNRTGTPFEVDLSGKK